MGCRVATLMILPGVFSSTDVRGTIIDRIALIVGTRVVKDSDIVRDIRVTSFLNQEDPDLSLVSRKRAASRLSDQEMIRTEIQSGAFPVVPGSEVSNLLAQTKKARFSTDAQYRSALAHDGITEPELKDRLLWQLTVLRFIDSKFRPMVVISDEDVQSYYDSHRVELGSGKSLEDLRPQIQEQITGERINDLFEEWLKQTRQGTRIVYREKSLE